MKRLPFLSLVVIILLCNTAAPETTVVQDRMAGEKVNQSIGAPSELRIVVVPSGFQLHWKPSPQDPGKVTGYDIFRSVAFSGPYDRIAKVDNGVFAYIDSTASPNQVFFYKVRATAGEEHSHFSNIAAGERP